MAAYLLADLNIHDLEGMEKYRERVPAIIAQFGGRYLVRGGEMQVLEGDREPSRIVIVEFPDLATVRRFYKSPEYAEILPLRLKSCDGHALIVDGYTG